MVRSVRLLGVAVAGVMAGLVAASAQVNVATIGPRTGTRVADFRLPDHRGTERTLSSLAGPKGTMLVFFRSADW